MAIRFVDKVGRLGRLQLRLEDALAEFQGEHVAPPTITGGISALAGPVDALFAGQSLGGTNRIGDIGIQLSGATSIIDGSVKKPGLGYTPIIARGFQEGTVGSPVQNFTPSSSPSTVTYSDDIPGPFGEGKVVKMSIANNGLFYGGRFGGWGNQGSLNGADLWLRIYHYFPSSFCAGYTNVLESDGYGSTKWIRLQYSTGVSHRLTLQMENFSGNGCGTGPRMGHVTNEGMLDNQHNTRFASPITLARNQWLALQMHVRFGTTRANSFVRLWVGDTFLGAADMGAATLSSANASIVDLVYGDYWNGGSRGNNFWYIANVIATRQQPNTVDSGGRPFISPNHDARFFD